MAVGGSLAMDEAFVSLTTNDQYGLGAYVLGKSLRKSNTSKKLVLLITSGVSENCRQKLNSVWDDLIDVTVLDSQDKENLALLARPELGVTFSKLRAWTLTQFKKCVFLDADTLVIQNVDDLFEREELSAAPDIGWPDCFNSGVFVFKPSLETYDNLLKFSKKHGSFDGGDQGLLNDYFSWWATRDIAHHLPFTYNMVSNVCYSYNPAYKRFGSDVKIVHFLGSIKPWHHFFDLETNKVKMLSTAFYSGADETFVTLWWKCFAKDEGPMEGDLWGAVGGVSNSSFGGLPHSGEAPVRRGGAQHWWEKGIVDYHGDDSFDKIMSHINSQLVGSTVAGEEVEATMEEVGR